MSQLKALVDKLLSGVSSAYIPEGYLVENLLPAIKSKQSSGLLAKYGNQHLRVQNSYSGGRGSFRRVESITRSTASFQIEGHGLEGIVTKEDYKNVELPYDAEKDETLGITTMLWLEKEKLLADTVSDTSIVAQSVTLSGTAQFSDYNNSDPLAKFSTARSTIRGSVGSAPNVAWMDWAVANVLRYHPQILDALGFKQNRPGGLSDDELATAMGVKKVLIAQAMYNSAAENQTDVLAAVWGKHIFFGVLPDKAIPYQTSLGYLVGYEGETPRQVSKMDAFNPPGAKLILVEDNYDMLISNAGAGYSIKSAIA